MLAVFIVSSILAVVLLVACALNISGILTKKVQGVVPKNDTFVFNHIVICGLSFINIGVWVVSGLVVLIEYITK